MQPRPLLVPVLLLVGLGASGFALREHIRRAQLEENLNVTTEARRRLEHESDETQKRVTATRASEEQVRKQLEAIRAQAAKSGPGVVRKAGPAPMTALRQALLNDPQLQALQIAAVQPKFESTYRPFFQELNLSSEQVWALLRIIFQRYEQDMDLGAIREMQAPPANDPVFARMKEQYAADTAAALTTLLGRDGYQRFSAFERTVPAREFLDQTAGATVVVGAPITGPQADALSQIISEASAAWQRGGTIELRTVDWDRVLTGANTILNESQLAVFRLGVVQLHNMEKIRALATTR